MARSMKVQQVIRVYVPIQNRAAGRTYDLKVYTDRLVIDDKDIDVALKAYNSFSLTDLKDLKEEH